MHGEVNFAGYTREQGLKSVGPGWASLVNKIFDEQPEDIKIIQVKEKLGKLVVYTDLSNDVFNKVIWEQWEKSGNKCEGCGEKPLKDDEKRQRKQIRLKVEEELIGPDQIVAVPSASHGPIRTYCQTCEDIFKSTGDLPWL